MNPNLSSRSGGVSAARPVKSAMHPVLIGIALLILVSKTVDWLAVAIICYTIIYFEKINGSSFSEGARNESLDSGLSSSEDKCSTVEPQEHRPGKPSKTSQQTKSPLFAVLPVELRVLIYRELLLSKSGGRVEEPHKLLDKKSSSLIHMHRVAMECFVRDPHIDSSILRTCRRVYQEGLPILYGDNVFMFSQAIGVKTFRAEQISKNQEGSERFPAITTFNLKPCRYRRLSMIRRLEIKITQPVSRSYAGSWEHFFLENREVGKSGVYFPNLEWLVLDLQEWNIQKDHFLVVQPFTAIFRSSLGLKTLVVFGLGNRRNIEELKCTLLRDGGELFPGFPPIQRQIK